MSFATEMLDKIENLLLGKADDDTKSLEFNGKSITSFSFSELMSLRDKLKAEVKAEEKANKIANGENPKNRVRVRF